MHDTKECHRRNIFRAAKSTQFPPPLPPRNPQHLVNYFSLSYKKRLDLSPTICKHPTLSSINTSFIFQLFEKHNEFPMSISIWSIHLSKKYQELIIQKARLQRLSKTFLTLSWHHCPLY